MKTALEILKETEKEISDLKKQIAIKESLLPGLRYAAQGHVLSDEDVEENSGFEGRLRMGEAPLKALSLIVDKGNKVHFSVILKAFGGDAGEARYAIRRLSGRDFVETDGDEVSTTELGLEFITKFREKNS